MVMILVVMVVVVAGRKSLFVLRTGGIADIL